MRLGLFREVCEKKTSKSIMK